MKSTNQFINKTTFLVPPADSELHFHGRFNIHLISILLSFLILLTVGCSAVDPDDSDDTTNAEVVTAVGQLGEVVNGTTGVRAIVPNRVDCGAILFGSCDSATKMRVRNFSTSGGDTGGCTRGTGNSQLTVFGQSILTFSSSNCSVNSGETITRTVGNHYFQETGGRKILIYSDTGTVAGVSFTSIDLKDYEGTSHSGGSVLTKGATDSLVINGIHRRALRANGKFGFWHTLFTPSGSVLSITRTISTTTISSGSVVLMHNRARIKVTKSLSNVTFSTSCCYPTSGTITYALVPASGAASSFTVVFSSCGSVTIDGNSATLPTCGS